MCDIFQANLRVLDNECTLSVPELYEIFFGGGFVSMAHYMAYCHFKRTGYIIRR